MMPSRSVWVTKSLELRKTAERLPRARGFITRTEREGIMQLDTSYLGMHLPHPFVAGASPFGYRLDTIKRLEDAGCAAVVLHSIFEEQVGMAREGRIAHMDPDDARFAEMIGYFPGRTDYRFGPAQVRGSCLPRDPGGEDSDHRLAQRPYARVMAHVCAADRAGRRRRARGELV